MRVCDAKIALTGAQRITEHAAKLNVQNGEFGCTIETLVTAGLCSTNSTIADQLWPLCNKATLLLALALTLTGADALGVVGAQNDL